MFVVQRSCTLRREEKSSNAEYISLCDSNLNFSTSEQKTNCLSFVPRNLYPDTKFCQFIVQVLVIVRYDGNEAEWGKAPKLGSLG